MNYLIIVPKYSPAWVYYDFPVGLAFISAALKKAGFAVWCLNLNHHINEDHEQLIIQTIDKYKINVVCTGGLVVHFNNIGQILNIVKKHNQKIMTIVGGGLISCEPELIFDNISVDCGVLGEGEETIVELARSLENGSNPHAINGLIFRNNLDVLIKTPAREAIADISSLPIPDYEGFELDHYLDIQMPNDTTNLHVFDEPRIIPVISSRSCPYQCRFCYHPLGNKYRSRSLDNFFAEVEYLIDRYNINGLLILDELLCHSRERLVEFCRRISQYHLRWMGQLRVDSVDTELLAMLKEAGCFNISYGIESAHNDILKSMRKNTTVEQIEKALDLTYQTGISLQGNLLFSDRSETQETAEHSIKWAMKRWYHRIQLTPLFALPNSNDYQYAIETGKIGDRLTFIKNGCGAVNLTNMSNEYINNLFDSLSSFSTHLLLLPSEYKIEETGFDFSRSTPIYSISYKCPHCGRLCHYENFCIYGNMTNNRYLHCKHCRGRCDIKIDWFDHYQKATISENNTHFLDSLDEYRKTNEHLSAPYKDMINMTPPGKQPGQYYCWRFKAHNTPTKRHCAIMLPMTCLMRNLSINLGKELAAIGIDTTVFEIPGLSKRLLSKCDHDLLSEFYQNEGITEVFSINALRSELYIPDHIRYQRFMYNLSEHDTPTCTTEHSNLSVWPEYIPPATWYDQYYQKPEPDFNQTIDIAVTFNYINPLPDIKENNRKVVEPYLQIIAKELVRDLELNLYRSAQELLEHAELKLNCQLANPRERIMNFIDTDLRKSVMQTELVRRLAYLSRKHKWNFRIMGKCWEKSEQFAEYHDKFVGYNRLMAEYIRNCKVVIHADGANNFSILDTLACGTFSIFRENHPQDSKPIRGILPADIVPCFSNNKELEKILLNYLKQNPEQRISAAQTARHIVTEKLSCKALAKLIAANQ